MKKGMKTEWKKICLITIAGCMLLEGCKASDSAVQSITPEKVSGGESVQSAQETQQEDQQQTNDQDKGTDVIDATAYIGEYKDVDGEPGLEIAWGNDSNYVVQIGIVGLTVLDDGVGVLSESGMEFAATDAAGNPIKGLITLDGNDATVTFTDSTWELIRNGDYFLYTKSSDNPSIW